MKNKKYELLINETIKLEDGTVLYRIKALKDFGRVKAGDLGGFIEKEDNLSHYGNCWVYNSLVYNEAVVSEDAIVAEKSVICGWAKITGSAFIYNSNCVMGTIKGYLIDSICAFSVPKNAYIDNDNCVFEELGSDTILFYKGIDGDVYCCFGDVDSYHPLRIFELVSNGFEDQESIKLIKMAKKHFAIN